MLNKTLKAIADLDTVIHNPTRLMLFYLLSRSNEMDYQMLQDFTKLSSGNISTHLNKMEEAGYIQISKTFIGKKPHTSVRLTNTGERAYRIWGESVLCAVPKEANHKQRLPHVYNYPEACLNFLIAQSHTFKSALYGRALPLPPMDSNLSY